MTALRRVPVLQLLGPSTGGVRRHVVHLSGCLQERGWPVVVAGPDGVLDGLRALDRVVEVPPALAGRGLAGSLRRARSQLQAAVAGAGLVHAHGLKAGWLAASVRPPAPVVLTLHNVVLPGSGRGVDGALRAFESALPARSAVTMVVSAEMARRFTGTSGAHRVRVVAPVSPPPAPTGTVAETRARLGVGPDEPLVVCVGRLHPQKGLDVLLGATAALRRRRVEVRVAFVGQGPLEGRLRRQAAMLGVDGMVTFAGPSANAADELAAADVVVVPSRWEGWPLVVSEALHLGRPVVASGVGGVPDMLDGAPGWLVEPGNAQRLADALERVLDDLAAARHTAGAVHAALVGRYPPAALVDQVEAAYGHALGRP